MYSAVVYTVRKKMAFVQRKVTVRLKKNGREDLKNTQLAHSPHSNILKMWAPLKQPALFSLTASPLEMLGRRSFFFTDLCFIFMMENLPQAGSCATAFRGKAASSGSRSPWRSSTGWRRCTSTHSCVPNPSRRSRRSATAFGASTTTWCPTTSCAARSTTRGRCTASPS